MYLELFEDVYTHLGGGDVEDGGGAGDDVHLVPHHVRQDQRDHLKHTHREQGESIEYLMLDAVYRQYFSQITAGNK